MTINRPPMGWNTWNTFGPEINEQLVRETVDFIVSSGLTKAGYEYIIIDDGWSEMERDAEGRLVADRKKFPSGMKALGDYIHSKGLKFGMYSCCGAMTCGGYPGSYDHEFIDAETFASWGVDYLKYDFCYHTGTLAGKYFYRRIGAALANCGRDIILAACSWGMEETQEWIKTTGAHTWRSTHDIQNSWASIKSITEQQIKMLPYGAHGCFNDMDMLIVGMGGNSFIDGFFETNGCTLHDHKTHFSIWSLFGSPLIIGCDIRNMPAEAMNILTNKEVIAINQDVALGQPYRIALDRCPDDILVYARLLEGGDFAIGCFNMSEGDYRFIFGLDELGITATGGKTIVAKELWSGKEQPLRCESFDLTIEPHGTRLFRCKVVNK